MNISVHVNISLTSEIFGYLLTMNFWVQTQLIKNDTRITRVLASFPDENIRIEVMCCFWNKKSNMFPTGQQKYLDQMVWYVRLFGSVSVSISLQFDCVSKYQKLLVSTHRKLVYTGIKPEKHIKTWYSTSFTNYQSL
jgi:hypothetical protein